MNNWSSTEVFLLVHWMAELCCICWKLPLLLEISTAYLNCDLSHSGARHWLLADASELECCKTKNFSWSSSVDGDWSESDSPSVATGTWVQTVSSICVYWALSAESSTQYSLNFGWQTAAKMKSLCSKYWTNLVCKPSSMAFFRGKATDVGVFWTLDISDLIVGKSPARHSQVTVFSPWRMNCCWHRLHDRTMVLEKLQFSRWNYWQFKSLAHFVDFCNEASRVIMKSNQKTWLDYSWHVINYNYRLLFHVQVIDYNYNYLSFVINYVIDYFCNWLLYNTAPNTMWTECKHQADVSINCNDRHHL